MIRSLLAALVLTAPAAVSAQTTLQSFDLERLSPELGSANSLVLATGDGLPAGTLRLSVLGHYENEPLVYVRDGERVGAVVGTRFSTHVGAAYAPLEWLELALQVPVVLRQSGDDLTAQGIAPVAGTAMGAPIIQARFSVLRERAGHPLDLGLTLGGSLPLGSAAGLTREPGSGLALIPRIGIGHTFGSWVRLGAEAGAWVRGSATLSPFAQEVHDEVGSLASLGLTASSVGQGLRGELNVRGLVPLSQTGGAVEVLGGLRYPFFNRVLEAFVLAGPGFGTMPGTPQLRVLGGFAWTPFAPPACIEGESYRLSDCPALDRDRDGVPNGADACAEQPGIAALGGCPDRDDDGDGVPNLADACPASAGPRGGCPIPDADGDGIPDEQDGCPQQAGNADLGGCAVAEGESDGVADAGEDAPVPEVKVADERLELSGKVLFELGRAIVAADSHALLVQIAETLRKHPEIERLRIEGHTDGLGRRALNLSLSQQRADAVRQFLVAQGVEASRLEARGYGPDRPVASNGDDAGRERNRRVEFIPEK